MKKLLLLASFALLVSSCKDHIQVDAIYYNAEVFTLDSNFTRAEAIAVKDGKIVAVGSTHDIRLAHRAPLNYDMQGSFIYPGFIDAHCHFFGYADGLQTVNLYGTTSWAEVVQRVKTFQEEHQLDFILGRGWDQNDWEDKALPNNSELNALFPNTSVYLTRIDGHAAIANQHLLSSAAIDEDTEVYGGSIHRDSSGALTGLLVDNAMDLVQLPVRSYNDWKELLLQAEDSVLKYGLTTLVDAGLSRSAIETLERLYSKDSLKIRIYAMVADSKEDRAHYLGRGPIQSDRLSVRSFKCYADGALGSRGACLLHPYHDDPNNFGLLIHPPQHYADFALELADKGWQMNTHAIGDSANRMMLDIYGQAGSAEGDKRWRIEHAQVLDPADFARFGDLRVIPSVQPTHATSDMYWAKDRLGPQRVQDAYAYKRLLQSYGKLALGTDFPVEHISPIKTFYAAVARKDASGFPEGGFQIVDALEREEALRGMTIWAAYSIFQEENRGSIAIGKWADFTILDRDWTSCDESVLLETQVTHTILSGELLYGKLDAFLN